MDKPVKFVTHHVPEARARAWDTKRRKKYGVSTLPQGFTHKPEGRDGFFYYREGDRVLELYYELGPGKNVFVNWDGVTRWVWPEASYVDPDDQLRIKALALTWLAGKGVGANTL
jgi:hypothetical protein